MEQAAERRGRIIQLGPELTEFQISAGFQYVTETIYPLPIGTWPPDARQRFIGGHLLLNGLHGMEGFTTMMFTKALGWSLEATQGFVEEVKKNMRDDSMRKVIDLHVVYGRKPAREDSGEV